MIDPILKARRDKIVRLIKKHGLLLDCYIDGKKRPAVEEALPVELADSLGLAKTCYYLHKIRRYSLLNFVSERLH